MFLFTTASRPALGSIQPPIQLLSGALSLGVKRPRREADNAPPCSAVKDAWSYTSTPTLRLHGLVLSYSTGATLPLPYNLTLRSSWWHSSLLFRRHPVWILAPADIMNAASSLSHKVRHISIQRSTRTSNKPWISQLSF